MKLKDLSSALSKHGHPFSQPQVENEHLPLFNKNIIFQQCASGVAIHHCDVIEQQYAKISTALLPCISITILLAGKVSFVISDKAYSVSCHNGYAKLIVNTVNKKTTFTRHIIKSQHVKKVTFHFNHQWLFDRITSTNEHECIKSMMVKDFNVSVFKCPEALQKLGERFIEHKKVSTFNDHLALERLSLELIEQGISELFNQRGSNTITSEKDYMLETHSLFTKRFNKLVLTKLSLTELAINMDMSISKLQRLSKEHFGQTAMSYIKEKRLEHAKSQLIEGSLSIGEISYLLGFNHSANFITAFKSQYGITPAQMKRINHKHLS